LKVENAVCRDLRTVTDQLEVENDEKNIVQLWSHVFSRLLRSIGGETCSISYKVAFILATSRYPSLSTWTVDLQIMSHLLRGNVSSNDLNKLARHAAQLVDIGGQSIVENVFKAKPLAFEWRQATFLYLWKNPEAQLPQNCVPEDFLEILKEIVNNPEPLEQLSPNQGEILTSFWKTVFKKVNLVNPIKLGGRIGGRIAAFLFD